MVGTVFCFRAKIKSCRKFRLEFLVALELEGLFVSKVHASNSYDPTKIFNFIRIVFVSQFSIVGSSETCPDVSRCPKDSIYFDGCCNKCNISSGAQTMCAAVSIPLNDTVKLISKYDTVHGGCFNLETIKGFSKCDGSCTSSPFFDERKYPGMLHTVMAAGGR